jgi:hypothetical protein
MNKKITMMVEEFENEQTGGKVEGVTVIIDGILEQFLDIIKHKDSKYENNLQIIQEALMKGLEQIKNEIN